MPFTNRKREGEGGRKRERAWEGKEMSGNYLGIFSSSTLGFMLFSGALCRDLIKAEAHERLNMAQVGGNSQKAANVTGMAAD